jgi:hypothetical protein
MARRTTLLTLGWILLGLGLAGSGAAAERSSWTPIGPDLSTVRALAVAPSGAVYAGTTVRGVFRSADGGARWSVPSQIPGRFARELAIDPGNPRGVYALTEAGLFYSLGGGAWQGVLRGNLLGPYTAFAVSSSRLYVYDGAFLQVSHDRGQNWEALTFPAGSSLPASSTRLTAGRAGPPSTGASTAPSLPSGSSAIPCTRSSGPSAVASSTALSTAEAPGTGSTPCSASRRPPSCPIPSTSNRSSSPAGDGRAANFLTTFPSCGGASTAETPGRSSTAGSTWGGKGTQGMDG